MRILRILRILTFLTILSANFLSLGRTASVAIVRPKSMEKAIDFCFRTGGAAGSVAPTQTAGVALMSARRSVCATSLPTRSLVVRCMFVRHYRDRYLLISHNLHFSLYSLFLQRVQRAVLILEKALFCAFSCIYAKKTLILRQNWHEQIVRDS